MRPAIKPRAVNDVGHLALDDQRKHARPVGRIVFEVGVLNNDDIAAGTRQTGSDGGAFPAVAYVKQNSKRNARMILRAIGEELEPAAGVQRQAAPAPG